MSNQSNSVEGAGRLQQIHTQAISEVKAHLKHWENTKEDYDNLSERISTLPLRLSHDIMVPFGPLAFMPGKLIHTNELLVHLGDSWFAETTCSQGSKIIEHRLETVNKNIEDLKKTLSNLEKKSEFNMEEISKENGIEIKENVPDDYVHPSRKKRVSRVKEKSSLTHEERELEVKSCMNDEELMARLDELERREEEEDEELVSSSENEETKDTLGVSQGKRVSWNKDLNSYNFPIGKEAGSSDSDDNAPNTTTIKFKHTATEKKKPENNELNPGNIVMKQFTKSILKNNGSDETKLENEKTQTSQPRIENLNQMYGVSNIVKEHTNSPNSGKQSYSKSTKRISKFKASQLK